MCIIATKPYGIGTIDHEILKRCFENNPDGAGFAYSIKGESNVRWHKGFMKYSDFESALDKMVLSRHKLENVQLLLHYRITTHGGTRQENTHPFPISHKDKRLKALRGSTDAVCAMNGIVDVDIPKDSNMSDTMHYIKERLPMLSYLKWNFYTHPQFGDFIKRTGAKWVFMDAGNLYHFGEFNENKGWEYSNFTWEDWSRYYYPREWRYTSKYTDLKMEGFEYGDVYAMTDQVEFEGVLVTNESEYIEVDTYDEVYIDPLNRIFQYSYDEDMMVLVTNIVGIYDKDLMHTNYQKMVGTV